MKKHRYLPYARGTIVRAMRFGRYKVVLKGGARIDSRRLLAVQTQLFEDT